jgi:predicted nucleotidyltransferase
MNELFKFYQVEGIAMPYTVEDYKRDRQEEFLASLTSEELESMFLEKLLKRLPPEELLKRLRPEERLKGLTREEIEAYLKKLSTSN